MEKKKNSLKSFNLSANSLIESIIALAIMASIIVISARIVAVIFKQEKGLKYYQTIENVKKIHYETIQLKKFTSEKLIKQGVTIHKIVNFKEDNQNLKYIEYSFQLHNKKYTLNYKINY